MNNPNPSKPQIGSTMVGFFLKLDFVRNEMGGFG